MDFSMEALAASIAVSTIGFGIFIYGKKQQRAPQLVTGLLLMIYPYFVSGWITMLLIGAGLIAGLWACVRLGL